MSLLPGVNVTCEPRDLDVLLQVPLNSEGENRYGWSLQICYEVRMKTTTPPWNFMACCRPGHIFYLFSSLLRLLRLDCADSNTVTSCYSNRFPWPKINPVNFELRR